MLSFFDKLFETRNKRILTTAIVSLVVFHFFYGLQTLLPGNISWLLSVKQEWGGHYLGWHFFKNEAWHFPLGRIDNLMAPLGTNISYTNSIPLLAIFFKLFSFALPEDFQYFGFWLLLCHFLVGYFTVLLLRRFRVQSVSILLAMIVLVANPVLMYRGLDPSLCAHWLIIASLYLFFQSPKDQSVHSIIKYQLLLLFLSAWIQPYLCAMVLGFTIALLVKLFGAERLIKPVAFFKYVAIAAAGLLLLWYILGIMGFGQKEDLVVESGYGLYNLNLNALYNSGGYSAFLPQAKQVSNKQYEGFTYAGLGVIVLMILVVIFLFVFRNKTQPSFFQKLRSKQNIPLTVLMLLFTLFAISHIVSFNERVLFTIPVPDFFIRLNGTFKAGGRFFWPVYYLLLLTLFIYWNRLQIPAVLKATLLVIIVIIQFADIRIFFFNRKFSYGSYVPPIEVNKWSFIMQQFEKVVVYPPFETSGKELLDYQYFCYLAAKQNKPITTGYPFRLNYQAAAAYIDSLNNELADGVLPENTLYITTAAHVNKFYGARLNLLDGYCFLFNKNINELTLLNTCNEVNEKNKKDFSSATALMNSRLEFKEFLNPPAAKEDMITIQIEGMKDHTNFVAIKGFAFVNGADNNKGDSVFITLRSPLRSFIAPVSINLRDDVTSFFKKTYLADAGFIGNIYKTNVPKGLYKIGLLIKTKDGTQVHQLTDKVMKLGIPEFGTMTPLASLPQQRDITANLEHTDINDSLVYVSGWGFLNAQDAINNEIYFVFQKENRFFISATEPVMRADVGPYLKIGFNVDNCGFALSYLKKDLPKGKYKTAILIKDIQTGKQRSYVFANEVEVK